MTPRERVLFTRMRSTFPCLLAGLAACGGKVSDEWAPPPDPDPAPGVTCGASVCQPPESCILTTVQPRACAQLADAGEAGAPCKDCAFASCDGPEDCAPGNACVLRADGVGLACAPTPPYACDDARPTIACHQKSDCPACFVACAGSGSSLAGASDSLQYGLCAHAL